MAVTLLTRITNPPARSPAYRQPPRRRPLIRIAYFVEAAPVYDSSGIDKCRFYRLTTTPAILVLVLGTNRSTDVGYQTSESWETASGVFSLSATRRHPDEKEICIRKMAQVWDDFETDTQSNFTTAMNLALNQANYKTEAGGAVV